MITATKVSMRKNSVSIFVFALMFFFSCLTANIATGIGPVTEGRIKENVYTAKNNMFSIAVPHKQGTYEYACMAVKEEFRGKDGAYVSFGPAAFNQGIYRIGLYRINDTAGLDAVATKLVENYKKQLEASYGTALKILQSDVSDTINGKNTRYWKLSQETPVGVTFNDSKPEILNVTNIHEVFVIDFGSLKALVWVQLPDRDQPTPSLTATSNLSPGIAARTFAESLIVH